MIYLCHLKIVFVHFRKMGLAPTFAEKFLMKAFLNIQSRRIFRALK